ncbi:MAG: glycerol-3-phosphate acyltransferase [Candidatus Promineifilaceae bacterium]
MDWLYVLLALGAGYLMGAIPFGFLFVKGTRGIDLRDVGSGRTGATNSFRAAGPAMFILTFCMDVVKGMAAVWLARWIAGGRVPAEWLPWISAAAGALAVIGHNWSVFLKFGGGAGTGPNVGWVSAIWLPMLLITFAAGAPTLYFTGMASVASLAVAAVIPVAFGIRYFAGYDQTPAYFVGGLLTAAIVTFSLRPNIKRILAGEERVVGPAAKRKENDQ